MSFGIDHPLLAVRDLGGAAQTARRLGFSLNPFHQHPWGTCNHLLLFERNMIELIGIDRPERLDYADDNGFQFGRMIARRLQSGEGVAMTALEAADMTSDHAALLARGFEAPPPITFRRQGHGGNGSSSEVAVSLDMLISRHAPWFSQFLCEQHNPALLRADPAWQHHPNTARNIEAVWCLAEEPAAHRAFFARIHGEEAIAPIRDGLRVETEKGLFLIVSLPAIAEMFPDLAEIDPAPSRPVALTLSCDDLGEAMGRWQEAGIPYNAISTRRADIPPGILAGTLLSFVEREH